MITTGRGSFRVATRVRRSSCVTADIAVDSSSYKPVSASQRRWVSPAWSGKHRQRRQRERQAEGDPGDLAEAVRWREVDRLRLVERVVDLAGVEKGVDQPAASFWLQGEEAARMPDPGAARPPSRASLAAVSVVNSRRAFAAERLRAVGHDVLVPDLFKGRVFDDYDPPIVCSNELVCSRYSSAVSLPSPLCRTASASQVLPRIQRRRKQRHAARGLRCHAASGSERGSSGSSPAVWPAAVDSQCQQILGYRFRMDKVTQALHGWFHELRPPTSAADDR